MTARERISYPLDDPSDYLEIGAFAAYENVWGAWGCPVQCCRPGKGIGQDLRIAANDATVKAGAWFPMTGKNLRAQEIALMKTICQSFIW